VYTLCAPILCKSPCLRSIRTNPTNVPALFLHHRTHQGNSNPKPFIQILYLSIVEAQSFSGSLALLKSIHSSRLAFSSLHTQHGYSRISNYAIQSAESRTFGAVVAGLRSTAAPGPEGIAGRVSK